MRAQFLHLPIVLLFLIATTASAQTLEERIDTVIAKVDNIESTLEQRTLTLLNRTSTIREEAVFVGQNMRAAIGAIDPALSEQVRNAMADLKDALANDREGLADFLGVAEVTPAFDGTLDLSPPPERASECQSPSPCFQFRADMDALLVQLGEASAALIEANGDTGLLSNHDFDGLRAVFERLPNRPLYPLYRVLVVELNLLDGGFLTMLAEARDAAGAVAEARLAEPRADAEGLFLRADDTLTSLQYEFSGCENKRERFFLYFSARLLLQEVGLGFRLLGVIFQAIGETGISGLSGGAAAGANVHVTLKASPDRQMGLMLEGMGVLALTTSAALHRTLQNCAVLQAQLDILAGQERIEAMLGNKIAADAQHGDEVLTAIGDSSNDDVLAAIDESRESEEPAAASCAATPPSVWGGLLITSLLLLLRPRRRRRAR